MRLLQDLKARLSRPTRARRTQGPTLALHIGLPKTATTFLQYRVFHSAEGFDYRHSRQKSPLEAAVAGFTRGSSIRRSEYLKLIRAEMPTGNVLVSNENISMNSMDLWRGKGPTPKHFCERVSDLEALDRRIRIVLGIRRQDQWLASRYAQSAKSDQSFCQEDFDSRLETICSSAPAKGAQQWLDFDDAISQLINRFGRENVMVIPTERVAIEPLEVVSELEEFLEVQGWTKRFLKKQKRKNQELNKRSTGADEWRLGATESTLTLSATAKASILERYKEQNQRASRVFALNLDRFDYF